MKHDQKFNLSKKKPDVSIEAIAVLRSSICLQEFSNLTLKASGNFAFLEFCPVSQAIRRHEGPRSIVRYITRRSKHLRNDITTFTHQHPHD